MSGGTIVPRHECPGGHFFQGDSHASDTGIALICICLQTDEYIVLSAFMLYEYCS